MEAASDVVEDAKPEKRWRVVATGPWDNPGWQRPLEEAGCEVILGRSFDKFPGPTYAEDALIDLIGDADVVLISTRDHITRRVMEATPNLRAIVKATIGIEVVDLDAAADLGILVCNSPSRENFLGLAEATVGLMLALIKRMHLNQQRLHDGQWKATSSLGRLFCGETVGIVGLGRVGSNVARRLGGWDVRLLAADPYVEPARADAVGAELVNLETLVRESDLVTLHAVLTRETTHLINERRLRSMKPTAYLVNTSRGPVIDEVALVRAIEENWIAGAALDVYEQEPLPLESPLRRLDPGRMILTPHSIGNNPESRDAGERMALESILKVLRGEVPLYVTNPAGIPRWRQRFGVAGR